MVNLPSLRQNRMKLKTLSLANQVVGWTLKRQGNSLSGTSKVGGRCLVLPSAMRSSKSKHFCRTILACWKREDKIINSWYSNEKTSCDILLVYIRSIQETKMISSYRPNFLKVDYFESFDKFWHKKLEENQKILWRLRHFDIIWHCFDSRRRSLAFWQCCQTICDWLLTQKVLKNATLKETRPVESLVTLFSIELLNITNSDI